MVSGDESWSRGGERPGSWKRSASDTCLDAISSPRSKRRRDEELEGGGRRTEDDVSSISSDTPPEVAPMDADRRDFLQMALDQICELQRKMRDEEDSDGDADVEIEDDDDDDSTASGSEGEVDGGAGTPSDRDVVLAGFDFCTKEALGFLVEQEGLGAEHPAVRALTAHLRARKRTLNCGRVLGARL